MQSHATRTHNVTFAPNVYDFDSVWDGLDWVMILRSYATEALEEWEALKMVGLLEWLEEFEIC